MNYRYPLQKPGRHMYKTRHRIKFWHRWVRGRDREDRIKLTFYGPKITNWSDRSLYVKFWGFVGGLFFASAVLVILAFIGGFTLVHHLLGR